MLAPTSTIHVAKSDLCMKLLMIYSPFHLTFLMRGST